MDKLLGDTTVVTESRTYLVDRLGKKSAKRAMVSAKSNALMSQDVEVTRLKPHLITRNTNKFLQISSPFPLIAHFIPGPPDEEYPEEPGITYTTGVIYAEDKVNVNSYLQISVYDPDVVKDTLQVTVFNATTGETEHLVLDKIAESMYRNVIWVELKQIKGDDFDGIMHASPDDVLRVIYQDGRGATGEPVNVVKNIIASSSWRVPKLLVRRACPRDGKVGVALYSVTDLQAPFITVENKRTNERLVSYLIPTDGGYWSQQVNLALIQDLVDGDVVETSFGYADEYGTLGTLIAQTTVTSLGTAGTLHTPASIKPTLPVSFTVDDPDVTTAYVDLVIAGKRSNKFTRVRANRVGINTGVYVAEYTLEPRFDDDEALTITYSDSGTGGAPVLIRNEVQIVRSTAPVDPEEPGGETPDDDVVQQIALQMEINGLFTLNGKFSGIVKLYAKEDETVRCSILQAN